MEMCMSELISMLPKPGSILNMFWPMQGQSNDQMCHIKMKIRKTNCLRKRPIIQYTHFQKSGLAAIFVRSKFTMGPLDEWPKPHSCCVGTHCKDDLQICFRSRIYLFTDLTEFP